MQMIVAMFLVVSGIASLTYQVVWVRLLGLSMGSTSASVATVLAAFFLGMAIGSYLAERITHNNIDNLRPYILLELCIGVSGLLLLPAITNLDLIITSVSLWGSLLSFKFAVTVILLIIPTACMGATFPVMAAILVRQRDTMGLRVSQLYSMNTIGAVLGALLSGFVFIPTWGLDGATYAAAGLNFFIVGVALFINSRLLLPSVEYGGDVRNELKSLRTASDAAQSPFHIQASLVLFCTGFVAIATEVGWTKYLSIFTSTTIYGFAIILAVFLFGIAAGSWWMRKYLDSIMRPEFSLALGLVVLGTALLFTRAFLTALPPIFEAVNHFSARPEGRHVIKYVVVFVILFTPTFVFGALFPLNLRLYCGTLLGVRTRIGKAYAINTVASIFGSVVAGFWIIPNYGTDTLLTMCAFIILILPVIFIKSIAKPTAQVVVLVLAVLALSSNWFFSHISYKELIASVQYQYDKHVNSNNKPAVLYVKEGKSGVISLVSYDDRYVQLQNNGLNESGYDLQQLEKPPVIEYLLGLIPYFLHEDPKSAFVVGYGGGYTTQALVHTERLTQIKVVELEPAIVAANKFLLGSDIPELKDPRVTLQFNDARNTLLLNKTHYDLIASQPSHPWLSRASTVFTQEFFALVKSRLNPGGIYGQWVSLFNMDVTTMRSILRAFYNVFPDGFTMADTRTGDFLMFGSDHPLHFEPERMKLRFNEQKNKLALSYYNLQRPEDLLWYYSLSRQQVLSIIGSSEPNTDLNILSEVRLSALDQNATGNENPYKLLRANYSLDADQLLGSNAAEIYYTYAQSLLNWREFNLVHFVIDNLEKINPDIARAVKFDYYLGTFDEDAAVKLYQANTSWSDNTRLQYADLMIRRQQFADARHAIDQVQDDTLRRVKMAKWLFLHSQFKKLAKLKPVSDEERMWQLTGLAEIDLKAAGKGLSLLAGKVSLAESQIQVLIRYFSVLNNDAEMNRYVRLYVSTLNAQAENIKRVLNIAIEKKAVFRARALLARLETLNPDVEGLSTLQDKVVEIEKAYSPSQKPISKSTEKLK